MKIKIYGYGWVGKAMETLFPEASIVDPALYGGSNWKNGVDEKHDVAFICVPTPLFEKPPHEFHFGGLDCSIVEDVVAKAPEDFLIIRSTVMPGTCDMLAKKYNKRIVFQPEYLGETANHPMTDQKSRPFMILGGNRMDRRAAIEVYQTTYNANITIRQVSNLEAEVIKLTENRAIAFKVAQCQELYDVCEAAGVDYYTIRDAVYGDDPRFNLWFTFIYPHARGFNSKCIPKDVYGWAAWAESVGIVPLLTNELLDINELYINALNYNSK